MQPFNIMVFLILFPLMLAVARGVHCAPIPATITSHAGRRR